MDMIGLNSQRENRPSFHEALLTKKMLTASFDLAYQDRLAAAWTPDEMIDDEMHTVLIALVLK